MASNLVRIKFPVAAVLVLALIAMTAPAAYAQTGQLTGTVTNAASGAGIGQVQVFLEGQDLGALTRPDGRYLILNVRPGVYDLTAQRIGFAAVTQAVTVTVGGTATTNFALEVQALGLDEIVVTGTAGAATRREIGNTIAQINIADIPDAPLQISDMLQAAAPGLDVYGGGSMGQAKIIRIRGANSAMLNSHPLIYIDGVRIRSEPLPDANPPDRRGGRSGNIAVSPLDNINPADIERIEIIKGSAATTLYGTEAAGGVIQVFTKRGTGGAPVWTASLQTGTEWSRQFGVDGSGIPYNGMEHFMCTGVFECGEYANQSYNQDYSLSVRGGSGGINYFVSGSFSDAQGMLVNDTQNRYSTRANMSFQPTRDLQVQWNTSYVNLGLTSTNGQNNAQGITLNAFRQERNYFATGDPAVLSELLEQQLDEDVERFTTGVTLTYTPIENMSNRFIVGYDWSSREHRNLRPFGWNQVPEGSLLNNTYQNRVLSLDYVGSYRYTISDQLATNFSWGGQATGDDDRLLEGFAENFPGAADPTISSGAERLAFEDRSKIWNAGFFFQNVLDVSNKYFLTLGVRVDGNSAFGSGFGLQVYPKGSVAYVLSDEDFYPDLGEMKLRFAYGQSGRAPGAFDAVRTWSPEGLAGIPAFVPQNVGNPDIGPEVTTEMEGGFDASWLNNRVTTIFTYYRQITDDALFNINQLPSGGFTSSQLTNIGKIKNSGIEFDIDATVYQSADWGLDLGLNFSTNNSEILELNDPNLETGCRKVGYPLRARCNERIANPDELVSSFRDVEFVGPEDPEYQGDGDRASEYFWGSNLPTTFLSPSIRVRAPGGISISARGDYKGGFYMNEQVFSIGRAVRSPLCFPYYSDPENSNALKDNIPAIWMSRCNTNDTEGYMWDASFFKLRSVSATIPVNFAFPDRVGSSELTVALHNSFLWMKDMPFMDPEASADPGGNTGPQQGYNFEETVPAPIAFRVSLRVVF